MTQVVVQGAGLTGAEVPTVLPAHECFAGLRMHWQLSSPACDLRLHAILRDGTTNLGSLYPRDFSGFPLKSFEDKVTLSLLDAIQEHWYAPFQDLRLRISLEDAL